MNYVATVNANIILKKLDVNEGIMKNLIPVKQKQFLFYDDEITVVKLNDGRVFVPIRPLCDNLGTDWSAQRKRIVGNVVLSDVSMSVAVTATDIDTLSKRPHTSEMLCLPLDYLNGWLFGINVNRVKPEIREKLIQYQKNCYQVLADAFQDGSLTSDSAFDTQLQRADSDVVEAYHMALAVVKLARNQVMLEGRIDSHERQLRFHDTRLEDVEDVLGLLGEDPIVSDAQASQISQAVKSVGTVLGRRSGRNEFGGVYGELYRRYTVSGYKMLPAKHFRDAMAWLAEWLAEVNSYQQP